ncbi:M15 family metallopeptidase [Flintibacter faecis]|uniref:M15 family metallopeptidase n=1 Tax=Flintibacter faecis TaxID=2763047 RepID=A0A8J6IWG9_9FIRM|nr:M15 family metallopeptidase [Flintibacter faecis]MBC5717784.1 M15 family metallopeptidase [Flintibacter faecis]
MSTYSKRILAGALSLALCLSPAALAAKTEEPPLVAAVEGLSPLLYEPDPAAGYHAALAELAGLGYSEQQAEQLWARLGERAMGLAPRLLDCLALENSRLDREARYLAYVQAHPEAETAEIVTQVNLDLDLTPYDDARPIDDPADPLVLVNKYHGLSETYVPELEKLGGRYGVGSMVPEAAAAFRAMADAAKQDGISLRSVSAYRSYQTQQGLYQHYVSIDGKANAERYSARPGYSEHQTGLALDINTASISAHFENTAEYAWLRANCARFGFLLRYPREKESITGYRYEPWHYRYVGQDIARTCMDRGLTYEEYLAAQTQPGENQAPALFWQGQALDLGDRVTRLSGVTYVDAAALAAALGWTGETGEDGVLRLSDGLHKIELPVGRRALLDGMLVRLSGPTVERSGGRCLPLSDLCPLLGVQATVTDQGVELAPRQAAL